MATIKLGAIFTEIAGSVGGTTFRRGRNLTVMQNKQFGASKNRLLGNKALPKLTTIIQSWSSLVPAEQTKWNNQALNFQFPNKFGDPKNLSGRELYIKLFAQNEFIGNSLPDVDNLSSLITTSNIDSIPVSLLNGASIKLVNQVNDVTISCQVDLVRNNSVNFSDKRREIIFSQLAVNEDTFFITSELNNKYPNLKMDEVLNFYVFFTNEYGFRSQKFLMQSVVQV